MDEPDLEAPQLGDRVREIVSGKTGVCTGVSEFLWGCEQFLVYYDGDPGPDGKTVTDWLDVGRLEVVQRGVVDALRYSRTTDGQSWFRRDRTPAFSGADIPPPAR